MRGAGKGRSGRGRVGYGNWFGGVDLNKSWFESGNVAVSEAVGELIGICVGNLQETGGSLPSRSQNQTVDREAYTYNWAVLERLPHFQRK